LAKKKSKKTKPSLDGGALREKLKSGVNPVAAQSKLFDNIVDNIVRGQGDLFGQLSEHERTLVTDWLTEAVLGTRSEQAIHDMIWDVDYVRKPAPIEQFIEDDYYLGRFASELHPNWKRDLCEVFKPGSQIFEWIMTGAIGIGKTTLACVAIAYKLHCLSCLRDASKYYGLLSDSLIVFGIYSITKKQVSDSGYYKLRSYLDGSPYFRTEFPRSMKIDSKVVFTKRPITVVPGSQELHALGLDLFSFLMDEVNFMRVKNNKEQGKMTGQAYDLYNATYTRLMSRFIRPGGTLPGLMLLLSSRNSETSFLEEHLKLVKDSPHTYVSDYKLWEVKPAHKFTQPKFVVEIGDRVSPSRLLKEGESPRRGARTVEVPGEFKKPFLEDIDQALRDIAGVATFNLSPLIRDRQSVFDCVSQGLKHPFSQESIVLDINDDILVEEYWQMETVARIDGSRWKPKRTPGAPRFIHIDNALSGDCLGIAMGHVAGVVKNDRVNSDGTSSTVRNPFIVIDFMLQVRPPVGSEIDLSKVRAFVLFLSRLYDIKRVTMDGFQSRDAMQILQKEKIEAGYLSVDRTDEAYINLRSALFDRRIAYYHYDPFITELLDLERDSKSQKVDHPIRSSAGGRGSKDVTDAVAGVVWHCINDPRARSKSVQEVVEVSVLKPTTQAPDDTSEPDVEQYRIPGTDIEWGDLRSNLKQ
jgi:hypothetical protein